MSQALYRKWRPVHFGQVVGQNHVTRTLQNSVAAGRIGHAYLFCGPRGTGKTTTARLVAKAANCLHEDQEQRPCNACAVCTAVNEGRFLDLIEIDAASNTGVDDIRDLRDKINFSPNQGRYKVYIIDEVHMLSTAAFNALLKTLEEPPPHAMFVLATTEEHKVPLTIKSRCQQFNFRLLSQAEIVSRLEWLAEQEELTVEPEALAMMARQGAGSIRDAESLLDQLVAAPGDTITLQRAQMVLGTAADTAVTSLTTAWLEGDGAAGLDVIHEALASGADARQFCRQMVAYLRQLLLLKAAGTNLALEGTADRKEEMEAQAQRASRQGLIQAVKRFNEAATVTASSWQPQLPLELAFIELLPDEPATAVAATAAPATTKKSQPAAEPVTSAEPTTMEETAEPESEPTPSPEKTERGAAVRETVEEAPVEPAAAPVPPSLSLQQVSAHWQAMVVDVGQHNKNLPPLLNMGKPLAIEGNVIVLGFDYAIFKDKFEGMPNASRLIAEAYTELLGVKCSIRSVVTSDYTVPIDKEEFHALADELGGIVHENE